MSRFIALKNLAQFSRIVCTVIPCVVSGFRANGTQMKSAVFPRPNFVGCGQPQVQSNIISTDDCLNKALNSSYWQDEFFSW